MAALRIVFAGSPAAAVPSINRLAGSQHELVTVITRADASLGRKRTLTPTPVADAAARLDVPVIKSNRLDDAVTERVKQLQPDLGVIVAYGGLVREPLLSIPRLGWINLHFSLLPRWRGAAPVQRAVMAGDEITGTTVFQLVPELDAGDWFGQSTQSIGHQQTAGHLLDSLAHSGAELLLRVVDGLADGSAKAEPQEGDVTLAPKLILDDGRIDWSTTAEMVHSRIRGTTPEPGAFTTIDGARVKILEAIIARDTPRLAPGHIAQEGRSIVIGTATDPVEIVRVHPAGRNAMTSGDWWRGRAAGAGTVAE